MTLIDPYLSKVSNKINDSAHVANVRVASSNLVSCSTQAPEFSRVYEMFGGFLVLGRFKKT